jgi:pyruvate formate lyase activating enzyme
MKAYIAGVQGISTVDYPKKIASVVFLAGCNFRCRYCFNANILDFKEEFLKDIEFVKKEINKNLPLIDAIVITGGEPCLQKEATIEIAKFGRKKKLLVGIFTNGSFPLILKELIEMRLLDFIAIDVKTILEEKAYENLTNNKIDIEKIKESIELVKRSGIDYELRTTLVPSLVGKKELKLIHEQISPYKTWAWQMFRSDIGDIVDKSLVGKEFSKEEIDEIKSLSKKFENVVIRF